MSPSIGSGRPLRARSPRSPGPLLARWRRIPGPPRDAIKARLLRLYAALERRYGAQGWWPGRTRYEIAAGAVLVQFTAWPGAARALRELRARGLLTPARLAAATEADVASAIQASGTYRQKARRLRAFTHWLIERFGGRLEGMRRAPLAALRQDLVRVHGIGPETADAILLYAAGRPVFVADEYARRVLGRHRLIAPRAGYEAIRAFAEAHLPADPALFNEYHALLVAVGREHCGTVPRCECCPLKFDLPSAPRGRDRQGAGRRPGRRGRGRDRPSP